MHRREFIRTSLGAGAVLAMGSTATGLGARGLKRVVQRGRALGAEAAITVLHEQAEVARRAAGRAFAELQLVESLMSIYRTDSQLSRLNRDGSLDSPHPYLLEVLQVARRVSKASRGAFDVTVQPLWQLYADGKRRREPPATRAIAAAVAKVDWRRVQGDGARLTIGKPAESITLNGIAQGFAADRAKAALLAEGIEHALIDTGELACLGRKSPEDDWRAGVQHPRQPDAYAAVAPLGGRSLATSGDYETTFSADRRRNHLFDPRTGRSPQLYSSVSVLARTATQADALSTALFATRLERGVQMLREFPDADALLIMKSGRTVMTPGFPRQPR